MLLARGCTPEAWAARKPRHMRNSTHEEADDTARLVVRGACVRACALFV